MQLRRGAARAGTAAAAAAADGAAVYRQLDD